MSTPISKLVLSLIVVLAFVLICILLLHLFYVVWHRPRRLRRGSSRIPMLARVISDHFGTPASNEFILYNFLCYRNQFHVGTTASSSAMVAAAAARPESPALAAEEEEEEDDEEDYGLEKLQAMCPGPSRLLYTIKEDERGEMASSGRSGSIMEVTPFRTPCASPPFYTPVASPLHSAARTEEEWRWDVRLAALQV